MHSRVSYENTNNIHVQNILYLLSGCTNGYVFNHDHVASEHSIPYIPNFSCSFSFLILERIIFIHAFPIFIIIAHEYLNF